MDANVATIIIKISDQALSDEKMNALIKMKVNTVLGTTSIAKLSFFDEGAALQADTNFAIGKSIQISIGTSATPSVIFEGDITRVDYIFTAGEADQLQLICYDGLHRLSKIWHSRVFVEKKISDIATTMATEASLTGNSIDATTTSYDHLYQNNQSNLDFLRMHAKKIGYEVDIDGKGLVFKKARYESATSSSIVLEWGEELVSFSAKVDSSEVLSSVVVSSWDSDTKENVESTVDAGSETKIGSAKTMGTSTIKSSLKSEAKVYRLDLPNITAAEAKTIATTHLTTASLNYLIAEGECVGEPNFALGKTLEIKGVGAKISGNYYITGFEHIYSNKAGFKTSFTIQSNGTFT